MNDETKPEETAIEPNTRAETERLEREEKRREREAECVVINAVVDKINTLVDRMNELTSQRMNVRHAYGDAAIRLEMDRTEANAAEMRTINNRLHEIDREHFNISRELAILEVEYTKLKLVDTYDEKWSATWSGLAAATALMSGALAKFMGTYVRTEASKKTP